MTDHPSARQAPVRLLAGIAVVVESAAAAATAIVAVMAVLAGPVPAAAEPSTG